MYPGILLVLSLAIFTSKAALLPKNIHNAAGLLQVRIKMHPKDLNEECLDCQPSPLPSDLKEQDLRILIGPGLDRSVVSITKPKDFTTSQTIKYSTTNHAKNRRKFIKNFVSKNSKEVVSSFTRRQRETIANWLEEQSVCPIKIQWKDMGKYSWPRYVKRANCIARKCSLDGDMSCTASSRRFFPLLRWYCIDALLKNNLPPWAGVGFVQRSGYLCRWVKYRQPITTKCTCKCKT